jgi:5-deoxy-glucuronate isomerase
MNEHLKSFRSGFGPGFTTITDCSAPDNIAGLGLGVLRMKAGERKQIRVSRETAWLLMAGESAGTVDGEAFSVSRASLFDESCSCLHASAGSAVTLEAISDVEWTVYDCANEARFEGRIFSPAQVPNEYRGKGLVGERALRYVRTAFDGRNSPPQAQLVLGEVVTFPGGWSSYPPHHHPQPEIYHYRFSRPEGYGHAELGEDVVKVRAFDTIHIPAGLDHAQCAAPGYAMYYSWVIRHLAGNPYTSPEFTADHTWTLKADADYWRPQIEEKTK